MRIDGSEPYDDKSQKEELLKLAIKWDCFDQATELLAELQYTDVSTTLLCSKVYVCCFSHRNSQQNYSNKLLFKIVRLLLTIFFELIMIHVVPSI